MTRDDAITIVEMVVCSWPGQTWDVDRLESYINAIIDWDAEVTTKAVARAVQALKYRPSVAELREYVQVERRAQQASAKPHPNVPSFRFPKPEWVERWERARKAGDMRPFPEQRVGMEGIARMNDDPIYLPPGAPFTDSSAWIQPSEYAGADADAIVSA